MGSTPTVSRSLDRLKLQAAAKQWQEDCTARIVFFCSSLLSDHEWHTEIEMLDSLQSNAESDFEVVFCQGGNMLHPFLVRHMSYVLIHLSREGCSRLHYRYRLPAWLEPW